jgi:hypothetical protein
MTTIPDPKLTLLSVHVSPSISDSNRRSRSTGLSLDRLLARKTLPVRQRNTIHPNSYFSLSDLELTKDLDYSLSFRSIAHYHIFIGDISPEINDEALSQAFGAFGTMTYVVWRLNSPYLWKPSRSDYPPY